MNSKNLENLDENTSIEVDGLHEKRWRVLSFLLKHKFEIVIFTLFFLFLIKIRITTGIYRLQETYYDWEFYAHMARDITSIFKGEIIIPFLYRPLMPFIAGIMPFDLKFNFAIITFITLYFTGIFLYYTLRIFFDRRLSAAGLLIFCYLSYLNTTDWPIFTMFFFLNYMIDPLAFFFLIVCFYGIFNNNNKIYAISLFFGTLTKEIVLFTIPVFIIHQIIEHYEKPSNFKTFFSKQQRKENLLYLIKTSKFYLPALGIFFLIRIITIPAPISEYPWWYDFYHGNDVYTIETILMYISFHIGEAWKGYGLLFYTIGIWGIIPVILCFFNKKRTFINWIKYYGIFMILTVLQLLLGNNKGRFMYVAFFPVIYLAISGLDNMSQNKSSVFWAFLMIILAEILVRMFDLLLIIYDV